MYINDNELNKKTILTFIKENKIISAIKYVRDFANIGLKDAKDIVDNLAKDENFYDNKKIILNKRKSIINKIKKSKKRKGNHVIKKSNNQYKIIVIFILIIFLAYYFLT